MSLLAGPARTVWYCSLALLFYASALEENTTALLLIQLVNDVLGEEMKEADTCFED